MAETQYSEADPDKSVGGTIIASPGSIAKSRQTGRSGVNTMIVPEGFAKMSARETTEYLDGTRRQRTSPRQTINSAILLLQVVICSERSAYTK